VSAAQRNKGAAGERELVRLLGDRLGLDLTRRLSQWREGGHDLDGCGLAFEVKRRRTATPADVHRWWTTQPVPQGKRAGLPPCLAIRADRQPWRLALPLDVVINDESLVDSLLYFEVDLHAFCVLYRNRFVR